MNEGDSWENIPEDLVIDCAQLTKANSIEGVKRGHILNWHVVLIL
jgi:coiled-coil domain-containing protein 25